MWILLSVALGFLLDLCFGDPVWLPHPVVLIGKSISRLEKFLRQKFPQTPAGETKAGVILAVCIPLCSLLLSGGILLLAYHISFWLWFVLHTFWSYQILAARCLEKESRKVYRFLAAGDLSGARTQLSYLVGRETSQLSAEEVTKACVETVAENTSDGVTAPLFYLLLGGVPLGFCYKAINTLDSMVGYRNAKYLFFGRASAKTDDAANWLPARICGVLLTVSAFLLGLDGKGAWRIFAATETTTFPRTLHRQSPRRREHWAFSWAAPMSISGKWWKSQRSEMQTDRQNRRTFPVPMA